MNKPIIYIIRHGETDLNNKDIGTDRIRGWANVPLNEEGRKEADRLGVQLKSKGIKTLVSSDLSRAADTAAIIGSYIGVKPTYTQELRPWDLGQYTGQITEKVLPQLKPYLANPDRPVPGGESFNQFKQRALGGIDHAVQGNPDPVGIVTHNRVERLFSAWEKTGQDNPSIDMKEFVKEGRDTGALCMARLSNYPGSQQKTGGNGGVLPKAQGVLGRDAAAPSAPISRTQDQAATPNYSTGLG